MLKPCAVLQTLSGGRAQKLVRLLPDSVRTVLEGRADLGMLVEVVMDLGRAPVARFPGAEVTLSEQPVTDDDLAQAVAQVWGRAGHACPVCWGVAFELAGVCV
eukprot:89071-Chlamydomonas_euryale.AAC.1